jgi:DNA-binding MarR family transcriptional regulator
MLGATVAPLRLSEVAARLGVTLPTASDAVAALVTKGLATRERAVDDARATALRISASGRTTLRAMDPAPSLMADAVEGLSGDDRAGFLRGLVTIVRALQERGDIAPMRTCVSCRFFEANAHAGAEAPHHCHFVNAPFGDAALRLDCGDQEPAEHAYADAQWESFRAVARTSAVRRTPRARPR